MSPVALNLDKLLRPSSVAVVGASDDGAGGRVLKALKLSGYRGRVFAVNPKRREVLGVPCFPSLRDIPEPVDCAYLATPAAAVLSLLDDMHQAKIGAAIVYATGFAEANEAGRQLQDQVAAKALAYGIALCGPSSLGLINGLDGFPAFIGSEGPADAGPIAIVSQSGGFIDAVRTSGTSLRTGIMIASGNEAVLTAADYATHLLEDDRIRVIGLALEAVRAVPRMKQVARRAHELGKPIVVMKVGSSERGRQAALGHTGSLVGDDQAWDAFFAHFHMIRVRDLDEFIETLALMSAGFALRGPRVGLIGTSGGKAGLYADVFDAAGVPLPELAPATVAAIRTILGSASPGINPIDAGVGGVTPRKIELCLAELSRDPHVDLVGVYGDMPVDVTRFAGYQHYVSAAVNAAGNAAGNADKPIVFINTRMARVGGEPQIGGAPPVQVLHGARGAALAIGHLARWSSRSGLPAIEPNRPTDPATVAAARELLRQSQKVDTTARLVSPEASRKLLDLYGIARVAEQTCGSEAAAVAAAAQIGTPIVAKLHSPSVLHKSDAGLVRLGLADATAVATAWRELHAAHRTAGGRDDEGTFYLQRMLPAGTEIIAGLKSDPEVGPVILFGLGGIFVELMRAVACRLLPATEAEIADLVAASRAHAALAGLRGRPRADVPALVRSLAGLARLGWDLRHEIQSIDLNPMIALPEGQGTWAVDMRILTYP